MARVLVVGGTGTFGARLVRGLLDTTTLDVVVAGRNRARLDRMAAACGPRVTVAVLDVTAVTPDALRALGVAAVADTAGPYQASGYRLARAAIAAGLHFLDLADARDYVAGFPALDAAARAAGVVALTGASSTPALSNAALDRLTAGWRQVDRVEIAISPGNRAPRGLAVMRSILSYAGRPVRVFDGGWRSAPGWGMTVRRTMPGLGPRWLSLAETPDLDIVPNRFGVRQAAVFRAGLELPVLHLGLLAASLPVRTGLLRSLLPFARPFLFVAGLFERFGTDRGGMTVTAAGQDADGRPVHARWWLLAEGGHGPAIPTLPALALVRMLTSGAAPPPGASACVGVLTLAQIEAEFAGRHITSGIEAGTASPGLYERVLGAAFATLPLAVQALHRPGTGLRARGTARVDGASTALARLVAAGLRLPRAAEQVAVTVSIAAKGGAERWTRDFGGRRFGSVLSPGAAPGTLVERFGLLRFQLALPVSRAGVDGMPVVAWRLGPVPLPRWLAPASIAREFVDAEGRFNFDVELRLPLRLGRLVRYRGWLVPR